MRPDSKKRTTRKSANSWSKAILIFFVVKAFQGMQLLEVHWQTSLHIWRGAGAQSSAAITQGVVPAVQWPAMTTAFSATADQVFGLSVGDHVSFTFRTEGGTATIASIEKMK